MRHLEGWFYNFSGALASLTSEHGSEARTILEAGLAGGSIQLGVPGPEHGVCFSFDGVHWHQDTGSAPTQTQN